MHAAYSKWEANLTEKEEFFSAFRANTIDVFKAFTILLLALEELVEEVSISTRKTLKKIVLGSLETG